MWATSRQHRVTEQQARQLSTARRREGTHLAPSPPQLGYFHTGCSLLGRHCRSEWTTPRRRSPGRYAQTPRRMWKDRWSPQMALKHGGRRPSCRTSPEYEASVVSVLDGTRSRPSGNDCWRKDVGVSTSPNRTPTPRQTAMTLRGNVVTSTGRKKLLTRHEMLLRVVEPPRRERTLGRLGMTDKSTPRLRKTEPRNSRSYGSSK